MSYAFEAVVSANCDTQPHSFPGFKLVKLKDASAFVRVADRAAPFAGDLVERTCAALSTTAKQAVALSYDDRTGYRRSSVFLDGRPIRSFTLSDERWIPVDEYGEHLTDGPTYLAGDIPVGVEVDCVMSALHLGLGAIGFSRAASDRIVAALRTEV